jgi:hypothetical protein
VGQAIVVCGLPGSSTVRRRHASTGTHVTARYGMLRNVTQRTHYHGNYSPNQRQQGKREEKHRTPHPQGKTVSSRNSLVHGMTSGKFLPPDADPQEFFQLLDQFRARFQPFDEVEDALVERLVAAEFKMRSVRYMDAGLFHYQAETNPMPEQFNKAGRSNPLAWAFHGDSAYYNSFSKLMRYEGFLQREFSRALRDLSMLQADRRARLAEADAKTEAETAPRNAAGAKPPKRSTG